jgi:ribonuclease VapC
MVVDTSAIFAIVLGEPERDSFAVAINSSPRRLVSAATAVECVVVFAGRLAGRNPVTAMDLVFESLRLEVVPVDEAQWRAAADALVRFGKGRHPARLNLGDSFAYALAKVTGEPLLFKGEDFARTDIAPAARP